MNVTNASPVVVSLWTFVLGVSLCAERSSAAGGTNSWTKPTSGNWQEPYWSLGALPSINEAAVMFTNGGYKALAIDY